MADVADDGLVFHARHVVLADHIEVAGRRDEDIGLGADLIHADDAIALHGRLQGADRVDLGDPYGRPEAAQGLGGTLAHIAIAEHHGDLAGHHHIGGALDAIDQRLAAAIQIVKLGLGHGIIHIDRRERQCPLRLHLVQPLHPGRGLLGHAPDPGQGAGIKIRVPGQRLPDRGKQTGLFLRAGAGQRPGVLLGLLAKRQQMCGVAAVIQDHIRRAAIGPAHDAMRVIPVFAQALALAGEHRDALLGDRGGGVVLRGKDIAGGPAHLCAQCAEGLDEHGGLDGHMQGAGDAGALEGLLLAVFLADGHEARHLGLGDADFLVAPCGQREVGDAIIRGDGSSGYAHYVSPVHKTSERRFTGPPGPEPGRI